MSRIPGRLARRLDRLAWRAHAFHRYAHHPLCSAYRRDLLAVGRVRLCKGCTFVALGSLAGCLLGIGTPRMGLWPLAGAAGIALAWGALAFGGAALRPLGKGATRFMPALGAGYVLVQGLRQGCWAGLALAAGVGLGIGAGVLLYRRRGPWRNPCEACPERELRPCSGFRRQLRRERAFQRLASRFLASEPPLAL